MAMLPEAPAPASATAVISGFGNCAANGKRESLKSTAIGFSPPLAAIEIGPVASTCDEVPV